MPIYEYQAIGKPECKLCKYKFEVRQGMYDEPLKECPECGSAVKKLFSRPFILLKEPLDMEETFATYTQEEAGELGFEGGFAEDQIWD